MQYVGLYARVSTLNQSTGLEAQVRSLTAYCTSRGILNFKTYQDEGISGAKEHRPGLDRLMADVSNGKVSTVVVYSFSRFARSTKHLLLALDTFNKRGIAFVSLSESLNTTTAAGKMVFTVLAAVAELERELVRERVRNGLTNAKAKGKVLGRPKQLLNLDIIKHLHHQKMPHRKIAEMVGCSQSTVSRELRRLDAKLLG